MNAYLLLLFVSSNILQALAFQRPPLQHQNLDIANKAGFHSRLGYPSCLSDRIQRSSQLSAAADIIPSVNPAVLAFAALALGILANGWIQSMLSGDRGLGNFLSDGSGFGKSKFQPFLPNTEDRAVGSGDPLPWLRLPQLDFVEVAGQGGTSSIEDPVVDRLEQLREDLNERLEQGDRAGAGAIRDELERTMKENGISFLEE